ncbi:hypothetical protein [Paracoccus sp. S1E-3]|uniref:hypothetical protein n=1 Tax=Paracoccus sp. S1E-3 TaxID=2756130 RepID=UPI0015EE3DDF|nr:hypothetical protein [Paracoccus sp. S1E-3]MBA4491116.1 hypothetical protein [Paracoccus sp. S1E-3]
MSLPRMIWVLLALVLPVAAWTSEASDLVFADRAPWDPPATGLVWRISRDSDAGATQSELLLEPRTDADGSQILQMSERNDAATRPLSRFPISAGDPVVVYFLEALTRDMARMTGGSPFYIRNRIRDGMGAGAQVTRAPEGVAVVLTPFADDENAARMGGFASLSLRFDLGPDPTDPIRHLRAETGDQTPTGRPYVLDLTLNPVAGENGQ